MIEFYEDAEVGMEIPGIRKGPVERIQLVKYAGASGDFNPIHVDETFAQAAGYRSVIAHGMLSMGFVGEMLARWAAMRHLKSFGVRFLAITWPGDVITCGGKVAGKRSEAGENLVECEVWAENEKGEKTVKGTAVLSLPARAAGPR